MANPDDEIRAAQEFRQLIFAKLTNEKGVHADTALSAAGRMAGTFLLRSFELPMANLEPGTPVLSDLANEHGPALIGLLQLVVQENGIALDMERVQAANGPADAHLSTLEMQGLLEDGLLAIAQKHGLDYARSARAAAITAGYLVKDTAEVLDPSKAFGIAAYAFVEGSKTVPRKLATTLASGSAAPAKKKPWWKPW